MKLYYKDEYIKLIQGDCFEVMDKMIEKGMKVDMILCDLPYGTTQNKWDTIIPFEPLWSKYNKIIKDNGVIVLFGSEPFTSLLITSNLKMFKYNWIWQKNKCTGFLNAKKQPLNDNETISVFYKKQPTYNPQMTIADKVYKRGYVVRDKEFDIQQSDNYGEQKSFYQEDTGLRYPKRIQYFSNNYTREQLHPTQKPVELCEYIINTYTKENEIILDNTCGSGTTLVASQNLKRKCYGIELEEKYCEIAKQRLEHNLLHNSNMNNVVNDSNLEQMEVIINQ
jgi:site-specific DNA-methyltransferase (adenine-specific)